MPGGLNDNLQTILIDPCANGLEQKYYDGAFDELDGGGLAYIHRMSDMLEDLAQKLEGLLPKHFSTKVVTLHEAMQYSADDYYQSQYEDEEDDWGDEDGDCG